MELFPPGIPKPLQKTAIIALISFVVFGVGYALRLAKVSFGSFLAALLYFTLLGLFSAFAIVMSWRGMSLLAQKRITQKMEVIYQERGYCRKLADMAYSIPTPTDKVMLQHIFLLVMAEEYEFAETRLLRINRTQLSGREAAMYDTCRLRMLAMTGEFYDAQQLFLQLKDSIGRAYEMKPDLFDQYTLYADDALVFYMLAAAFSLQNGEHGMAEEYRRHAEFQITNRSDTEMLYYPQIFDLNLLYAQERYDEAHVMENEIRGEIESRMMPLGIKKDLLRFTEQAKVFGNLARFIKPDVAERRLPRAVSDPYSDAGLSAL